jgi:hypothetical protein
MSKLQDANEVIRRTTLAVALRGIGLVALAAFGLIAFIAASAVLISLGDVKTDEEKTAAIHEMVDDAFDRVHPECRGWRTNPHLDPDCY